MKEKVIRALYDKDTITVYQAYNKTIALHAIGAQTFVCPPFKKERMTWIKPSFLVLRYANTLCQFWKSDIASNETRHNYPIPHHQ